MFSIIIPLYNKAQHIEKTLVSVLNQTYSRFEIIVVNDGSTDQGMDIVRAFRDHRIRIIDQYNAGVSIARNNGVKAAIYKYIAFLDADDWWEPDYLAEMKTLIESFSDAAIYAAKYAVVKHGRKKPAIIGVPDSFFSGYLNYFEAYASTMWMPLSSSSAIMPSSVFYEYGGFKPYLKLGEDFELWVRVALKKPLAFLNKVLVYYNQDVNVSVRGVNTAKFHSPETHYIFNLAQFKDEEQRHPDLKILLDRLRAQALLKYHLYGVNSKETNKILQAIDFKNIPPAIRRQYEYPKSLVRWYWVFKNLLSVVKQTILCRMAFRKE